MKRIIRVLFKYIDSREGTKSKGYTAAGYARSSDTGMTNKERIAIS